MLTRDRELHEVNLGRHPKAEDVLWRPVLQDMIGAHAPWIRVRYAF